VSNSLFKLFAYAGQPLFGLASASLNQIACTCIAVTPAVVSRCCTTAQKFALGSWIIDAVCPPCAPSTGITCACLSGSAFASCTRPATDVFAQFCASALAPSRTTQNAPAAAAPAECATTRSMRNAGALTDREFMESLRVRAGADELLQVYASSAC